MTRPPHDAGRQAAETHRINHERRAAANAAVQRQAEQDRATMHASRER